MTLAAWAALTSRVRLGLMVGANTFRNPGLTAKLATTLDHISGGRAVLGIGGAWFEREHDAFGIDFGAGFGERLDRLDESVGLMRRLLDGERFDHDGPAYAFHDAVVLRRGRSSATCRSWSAARARSKTLRTVARRADALEHVRDGRRGRGALTRSCASTARTSGATSASIERTSASRSSSATTRTPTRPPRSTRCSTTTASRADLAAMGIPVLLGPPDAIADALRPYRRLGFETVIVRLPAPYDRGDPRPDRRGPDRARRAPPERARRVTVVVLAGGVGGAKLAHGVQAARRVRAGGRRQHRRRPRAPRPARLARPRHGPVHAGRARRPRAGLGDRAARRWAVIGPARRVYGEETWFRLGDRDLATHIVRTARLRAGARPTEVGPRAPARRSASPPAILPMADEPVRTEVRTDDGWLEFQEYFVHRHQEPTVREVRFGGIEAARPTPEVLAALADAPARSSSRRRTRSSRSGRSWPSPACVEALAAARVARRPDRRACRASSAARRSRARPTGCSRRSGASRARSGWPAATRGLIDGFVARPGRRGLGPGDRGARPAVARDRHGHDRRRRPERGWPPRCCAFAEGIAAH